MQKNNATLFLITNKSYLFALGAFLINLKKIEGNNRIDEIIIYHDEEIPEEDFTNIDKRIKFIKYTLTDWLEEIGVNSIDDLDKKIISGLQRYSHLTFAKHHIFKFLEKSKTVIYTDLDVLLRDSFNGLLVDDGVDIIWRDGAKFHEKFARVGRGAPPVDIEIKEDATAPNAGLIVVRDSFDYNKAYCEAKEYLKKYIRYITTTLDEQAIAYTTCKLQLKLKHLDKFEYNVLPHFCKHYSKHIHFMGNRKPWNSKIMQALFSEWRTYFEEFDALTGGRYKSEKILLENAAIGILIQQNLNMNRWLEFFKKENFIVPDDIHIDIDLTGKTCILNYDSDLYYEIVHVGGVESNVYSINIYLKKTEYISNKEIDELRSKGVIQDYKIEKDYIVFNSSKIWKSEANAAFATIYLLTKKYRRVIKTIKVLSKTN